MKRKFILRLLAVVMAASLTATSAPTNLLSTVYAATASDTATKNTSDFTYDTTSISINSPVSGKYYGLVAHGSNKDSSAIGSSDWKVASTSTLSIATGLTAGTAYDVYVADDTAGKNAVFLCTVTTKQASISDATLAISFDGGATNATLTNTDLVYDGTAKEGKVTSITIGGTEIKDANTIASNFDIVWTNNVNAAESTDTNAPTVTVTAKKNSIYTGSVSAKFNIGKKDLSTAKTQITINGSIYTSGPVISLPYDGLAQDPTIEVAVELNGSYVKLTRNVDYTIGYDLSTNVNENRAVDDKTKKGLDVTTDAGTVTLTFSGIGNYSASTTAQYEVAQSSPATPSAPVIKEIGDDYIIIDTSNEELKYEYEYLILTESELKNATYSWQKIVSPAATSSTKKGTIKIQTTDKSTKATLADNSEVTGIKDQSNNNLVLAANETYYVVRRIVGDANVKVTNASASTKVTMAKTNISKVAKSAIVSSIKVDTLGTAIALDTTFDNTAKSTQTVTLYDAATQGGNVISGGYTIKYYNKQGAVSGSESGAKDLQWPGGADSVEGDLTNAGRISIWAVADGSVYSGYVLIGYYYINKADITLAVQGTTMNYTGDTGWTDSKSQTVAGGYVEGLTATETKYGITVTAKNLVGILNDYTVGTRTLTAVYTNAWNFGLENDSNFNITYNWSNTSVVINKATVVLTAPASVTVAYGQTVSLGSSTNVKDVTLTYTLNNDSTGKVGQALTISGGYLTATDYDSIKDFTNIKIHVGIANPSATDNYTFSSTDGADIAITVVPAETEVLFSNDDGVLACPSAKDTHWNYYQHATGTITVNSYTRRSVIDGLIRTAATTTLNGTNDQAGIATGTNVSSEASGAYHFNLDSKVSSAYAIATTTSDNTNYYADITYKYYTEDGKTELLDIPTADGTYIVKAYLKASDDYKKNVNGSDGSDSSNYAGSIKLVIGDGVSSGITNTPSVEYTVDANGSVSASDGSSVADKVVTIDGTDKYVDADSKIVTGSKQLVESKSTGKTYAVDTDGSVIKSTKVTISGKSYITSSDGSIKKNTLATTPSDNKVYVGKDGAIVKNKVVTYKGKKYYATATGRIATNGFVTTKLGNKVYATKDGSLKVNAVFTVGKYKYYAGANGAIAKSGLTKTKAGNTVFATKSGKLKVNTTFKYKGVTYKANKKGVVKKVK